MTDISQKASAFDWVFIGLSVAFLSLMCVIGCAESPDNPLPTNPEKTYKSNIVRVFMHEPKNFSVLRMKEDKCLLVDTFHQNVIIVCDVPEGESMWYEINNPVWYDIENPEQKTPPPNGGYLFRCNWVRIHIHSALDINGGGWDHGKHGRGQTQVIE
jgi:hypothetical protein